MRMRATFSPLCRPYVDASLKSLIKAASVELPLAFPWTAAGKVTNSKSLTKAASVELPFVTDAT